MTRNGTFLVQGREAWFQSRILTVLGTSFAQNIFVQYWCAEKQVETTMKLQQLFGGYGYMTEYPIANLFAGARVQTIYGGTTEIMKELIARTI